MLALIKNLPKVELHAHLSGSVSVSTMRKVISYHIKRCEKNGKLTSDVIKQADEWRDYCNQIQRLENKDMSSAFKVFEFLHIFCDDEESIYMITKDVIADFAKDNVKYLELRTSPRRVSSTGMTFQSHIKSVLKAMDDIEMEGHDIIVRLLLSINREKTVENARDVVDLAIDLKQNGFDKIVGIDLSGNPEKNSADMFLEVLRIATLNGLKISAHLSEVKDKNEEITEILTLPPHRIGHGTYLLPMRGGNEANLNKIKDIKIPLELCLTSNVCTGTVDSYSEHHFKYWFDEQHPLCICTDDKGVFGADLSYEYQQIADIFNLNIMDLWDISYNSINHIFASTNIKEQLFIEWNNWKNKNS